MTKVVEIQPSRDLDCAKAVLTLQRCAYTVEAEVIGDRRIPNLTETLDQVRAAPLRWLASKK
nr:hypothetical protein [Rhodococcus sp. (in: high G+C Gram-positive bacteria)]